MAFNKVLQVAGSIGGPAITSAAGGIATAAGAVQALPVLGFGAAGVKAGSIAAGLQSMMFGATVPAGSWFAVATSWGATGAMATPLAAAAGPVGAVAAGAVYYYFKN